MRLPFLKERLKEFNVTDFVNELTDAAMQLGRALSKRLDVTVGQAKRYLRLWKNGTFCPGTIGSGIGFIILRN